jgi:uracil-DNA glycosylase family 4
MTKVSKRALRQAQLNTHYRSTYTNVMGRNYGIVPGDGNVLADVVFIGEAPGETEERMGKPFIGKSGNLLSKLMKSIGLRRQDVFITNLVKHRPPGNADPTPREAQAARVLMRWELAILKPKIVVTLGRFATEVFYPNPQMSVLAGTCRVKDNRNHEGVQSLVIPMYHPAAGLRSSKIRELMYEQMHVLRDAVDSLPDNPLL